MEVGKDPVSAGDSLQSRISVEHGAPWTKVRWHVILSLPIALLIGAVQIIARTLGVGTATGLQMKKLGSRESPDS